jgi:hypothetical protein
MLHPGIPDSLWAKLRGGLWHATGSDRLGEILNDNEIRFGVRSKFPCSFCAQHGRISLFDFGSTDRYRLSRFFQSISFFGKHQAVRVVALLEIDRKSLADTLWDARSARAERDNPGSKNGDFIHGVEACNKGPIPLSAVSSVVLVARDNLNEFRCRNRLDQDIHQAVIELEADVPEPPEDPLIVALSRRSMIGQRY